MSRIFRYLLSFIFFVTWTLSAFAEETSKISRSCLSRLIIETAQKAHHIPQIKGLDIDYLGLLKENGEINTQHKDYQKLVDAFSKLEKNYTVQTYLKARNSILTELIAESNHEPKPYIVSYTRSRGADIKNRLAIMRYARHNIIATYFLFFNDNAGQLYMKEIKYALSRGVDVSLQVNWALIKGMFSKTVTPRISSVLKNPLNLFKILSPSAWSELFKEIDDPYGTHMGGLAALKDWYDQEIVAKNIGDKIVDPSTGQQFTIKAHTDVLTGQQRKAKLNLVYFNPQRAVHYVGNLFRLFARFSVASFNLIKSLGGLEPTAQIDYNNVLDNQSHDKGVYADINYPGRAVGQIGGSNIEDLYYADHDDYALDNHEDQGMLLWSVPPAMGIKPSDNPFNDIAIWYQALIQTRGNDIIRGSLIAKVNSIFGLNSYKKNKLAEQSAKEGHATQWLNTVSKKTNKTVGKDLFIEEDSDKILKLYNSDGSINTAADQQTTEYLANKKNIGIADGDLTHNLQNLRDVNTLSVYLDPFYRRFSHTKNANSTMAHYTESIFAFPEITEEIRIGKAYMHLEPEFIQQLRQHLADYPHIKLVFHFNSVLSNDQLTTQQLFEDDVLPSLLSKEKVKSKTGKMVDVRSKIKVYMAGKVNDRKLTQNEKDFKTGLLHFKGTLIKRKGDYIALEDVTFDNDPRSIMEIGTHNLDGRSKWINSEVTFFFRKGSINKQLAHLPIADPAADIERYMVERLESRGHLYGSDEYYKIGLAVLEASAENTSVTPLMKSVIWINDDIVNRFIAKNGPLTTSQKIQRAKAKLWYSFKKKVRVTF